MRDKVYEILIEAGFALPENDEDFNLVEYLEDSMGFISAMVAIEDKLGIEISDEIFDYDSLVSFHKFCVLLEEQIARV